MYIWLAPLASAAAAHAYMCDCSTVGFKPVTSVMNSHRPVKYSVCPNFQAPAAGIIPDFLSE